jgi:hypothetical protein
LIGQPNKTGIAALAQRLAADAPGVAAGAVAPGAAGVDSRGLHAAARTAIARTAAWRKALGRMNDSTVRLVRALRQAACRSAMVQTSRASQACSALLPALRQVRAGIGRSRHTARLLRQISRLPRRRLHPNCIHSARGARHRVAAQRELPACKGLRRSERRGMVVALRLSNSLGVFDANERAP